MRISPILTGLVLIFFAVINADLAFSQTGMIINEYTLMLPVPEKAQMVVLIIEGKPHILTWVNPKDEKEKDLYNRATAIIKDHPQFKAGGPILFKFNPTCFWFRGRLY